MDNRREFEAYTRIRRRDRARERSVHTHTGVGSDTAAQVEVRQDVLRSAYNAWASMDEWRQQMQRNEDYVFADQHKDMVYDPKCERWYTEREMYRRKGVNPSQYNIIRSMLRSIVGVYSSNKTISNVVAQDEEGQNSSDTLTVALKAVYNREELHKLDIAQIMSLLVVGACVSKVHYANREGRSDVVVDYISPRQFFVDNGMKDTRYKDCTLVGCFYDIALDDVVQMFAKGDKKRAELLIDIYRYADMSDERILELSDRLFGERTHLDFFSAPNSGAYSKMARVIEVWRRESAECYWIHDYLSGAYYPDFNISEEQLIAERERRNIEQAAMGVDEKDRLLLEWEWGSDVFWRYYYLTPWGEVLDSGVNPYWHERPPFIFELHEFFDGKIYPFITDVIDANKQINKLAAITDLLVKYSAKSLLFVPVEGIDEAGGYDLEYIEDQATEYDAVIPYKTTRTGDKPYYVNTVSDAYGPLGVVNMFLKLSENVSGVYGALQGQQAVSGTPASMYAQQTQNSAVSLNGVFEAMKSIKRRRDKIIVQLMQQYYGGKRYVYDETRGRQMLFDHDEVKNIDAMVTVVENTDTPAYRLMVNDVLLQLKQFDTQNMLDLRGMIEVGNYPFKDKLLDYLNKRQEEAAQGIPTPAMPIPEDIASTMQGYQLNPEVAQALRDNGISESDMAQAMDLIQGKQN